MKYFASSLALIALVANTTYADDTAATSPSGVLGWKGKAEFGYSAASGNSTNSSMSADVEARRDWLKWALQGHAKARFASSDHVRSEENYTVGLQGNRKLSEIDYLFGAADYTVDNFSGYEYQATQTVGYGRTLFQNDKHTLNGQVGFGLRESETTTGQTSTDPLLKPELDYTYNINENVTFTENVKGNIGTEFSVYESETAVKSNLTGNLYLKASYKLKYTTEVPVGTKKTDTFTGISLGYNF